jgi:hypothetical protein
MGQILPGYPEQPDQTYLITLENGLDANGEEVAPSSLRVRLTWRERVAGWYLTLSTSDDVVISEGNRLCPGAAMSFRTAESPPGVLLVVGEDGYAQSDLGTSLLVVYYPPDEIPDGPPLLRQTLGP